MTQGAAAASADTRTMRIIAQDPSLTVGGRILTERIEVPFEKLSPGPRGYRVHVLDYDSSSGMLYKPLRSADHKDPFDKASDSELLSNPHFHAQNAYALIMRTLARFEFALGRRVSWSFTGQQLKVAPHAFAGANAFYSKRDEALLFGYFLSADGRRKIYTCLSHDIVVHETTHALVDGLKGRYSDPSSPEQGAFHEGFADVVALLSVYSLKNVVGAGLDLGRKSAGGSTVPRDALKVDELKNSVLLGLADEMGRELAGMRGDALRRSARLPPNPGYLEEEEFREPHRLGEILVAAMMNSFLRVWAARLAPLGSIENDSLDRERVIEEGASIAQRLLTMSIRALDYMPPTDVEFRDFLSALLTGDREVVPDDSRYRFRQILRETFKDYGISPTSKGIAGAEPGLWEPPYHADKLVYTRTNAESMQREPNEVSRFLWENRELLGLVGVDEQAYTRVQSVRPITRVGPGGFTLRETVAEYVQILKLRAKELSKLKIRKPDGMPDDQQLTLYGGGALMFDQYGRLKFHVRNRLLHRQRQTRRLQYLWQYGFFEKDSSARNAFAMLHQRRQLAR